MDEQNNQNPQQPLQPQQPAQPITPTTPQTVSPQPEASITPETPAAPIYNPAATTPEQQPQQPVQPTEPVQPQQSYQANTDGQSKDFLVALLLSIFVGSLGIDRFYLGYIGLGILKLVTFGGCGIWTLIDIVLIATHKLPDSKGQPLVSNH